MTNLAETIRAFVAQADANYLHVRARVEARAAAVNSDVAPTVDCFGRMHAPHDGYEWEGSTYNGGAFLPLPADFWEMLSEQSGRDIGPKSYKAPKIRIATTTEEGAEIAAACGHYAEVSMGKVWSDGVSRYAYISTNRPGLSELVHSFRAERDAERKAQARALKGQAPSGRVTVTAKVLAVKEYLSDPVHRYGRTYQDVTFKMLVELPNLSTAWGTVPAAIVGVKAGDTVTFTGGFEPSNDDDTHAFFKRPTKAVIGG